VLPGVTHNGTTYYAEGSGLRFLADHFAHAGGAGDQKYPFVLLPEPGALALLAV